MKALLKATSAKPLLTEMDFIGTEKTSKRRFFMKKLNTLILILFIILTFAACTNENQQETTTAENKQSASVDETIYSDINSKNEPDNPKETEASYSGGGELTLQKYRSIYYFIPSPFWDIVDENSRQDIYGEYWEQPYSQINTMRMRIFVEEYNVQ